MTVPQVERAAAGDPPVSLADLKKAIPAHCFVRSNVTSFAYLAADLAALATLAYLATWISVLPSFLGYVLWPLFWAVQGGGIMTGLWVIAHECGHRAFSDSVLICDIVGLIVHSALLVPYHSWRISHGKHHRSTGDVEKDEVYLPKKASKVDPATPPPSNAVLAIELAILSFLGWPGYLIGHVSGRDYGQRTNHFEPSSPLFNDKQRHLVVLSDVGICVVLLAVAAAVYNFGIVSVMCYYGVPLMCTNFWLVMYTYLHHTDLKLPHYDAKEWQWLKGALATVDRDYGFFWNLVHHHIGDTHVLHHVFSKIPHYHAQEATEAIKPLLGKHYCYSEEPIWKALLTSLRYCRFVDDINGSGTLWFTDTVQVTSSS